MQMFVLNVYGVWKNIGDTSWEDVIKRIDREITDKTFNENGIRIFVDSYNEILIYRGVDECAT